MSAGLQSSWIERLRLIIGPTALLHAYIWKVCSGRVYGGPFKGMRYVRTAVGSAYLPKLLGTYEMEIQGEVQKVIGQNWNHIVNVGAAEGYYTVGLATKCSKARVTAFETDPKARRLIRDLAAMNGVRVEVFGTCGSEELARVLQGTEPTLLFCDIEGAEAELLDPESIGALRTASLLVEVHEGLVPGMGAVLTDRFAATHRLQWFHQSTRVRQDFPWAGFVPSLYPDRHILSLLDEARRRRTDWLRAEPLG